MINVGIDTLAFYTPHYALDLNVLAKARGVDPDKYTIGLGQKMMAVVAPGEDIVTMAANAAHQALTDIDLNEIEMLLFATESGIDQSKSAGIYVHELLKLPSRCRIVELKQACYSGTAAIQLALPYIRENPGSKVLVIASDIARYGLNTTGESSQGAGAIAMVLSANPRVLIIEPLNGMVVENAMDFWRPNYLDEALVEGKYSSKLYLSLLQRCFEQYLGNTGRFYQDHDYFCYHTPVPRLVEKAHLHLLKISNNIESEKLTHQQIGDGLEYARYIGNSYSAALYIGLASLLDFNKNNLSGKRIGFYSYGSGCMAEFFSGIVAPAYRKALHTAYHKSLLANRQLLTQEQYETFYSYRYVKDGSKQMIPQHQTGLFRLTHLENHKRMYAASQPVEKTTETHAALSVQMENLKSADDAITVFAPGKLILSGEHAVVYGNPALVMAINRYAQVSVKHEASSEISLNLADLAYHNHLSLRTLSRLKAKVKEKYRRFTSGDFSIREVLQKPFELAQFVLGVLTDSMHPVLPKGMKVHVQSDIPMGCGMGSSAATILGVMLAISHYLKKPLSSEELFQLALEAENMQHGFSSGLDLKIAMHGGCLYVHEQQLEPRPAPSFPLYLVNTGAPACSTGECVEKVSHFFRLAKINHAFANATYAMDAALKKQSVSDMQQAMRDNHQLLVDIGVVPKKVQQFIAAIEAKQGAAKICGAGSIVGDQAGAVLISIDEPSRINEVCTQFGYQLMSVTSSTRGIYAA